jgi:hypothetical protein
MTLASCALRNSAPSLASAADAATSLRIVDNVPSSQSSGMESMRVVRLCYYLSYLRIYNNTPPQSNMQLWIVLSMPQNYRPREPRIVGEQWCIHSGHRGSYWSGV